MNKAPTFPYLGTISKGTMRNQDLVPRFLGVLDDITLENDDRPEYFIITMRGFLRRYDWDKHGDYEEASEDCAVLFDYLNEFAPEGYYFGAHPGDGADFGFWAEEEA